MKTHSIPHLKHLKRSARVAGLGAIAVLSLGSASTSATAQVPFVAQAGSLQPTALLAGQTAPMVHERVVHAAAPVVAAPAKKSGGRGSCGLDYIKSKESGGNYQATSPSGKYRGAYQFDQRTWESTGGSGDPAAASPEEQDARAAKLYSMRGSQPWGVCGFR